MSPVDDEAVARAHARLDARPGFSLTCAACAHSHPVPDDPLLSVYRCDECGAVTCFGAAQPRVVITPPPDRRFVTTTFVTGREQVDLREVAVTLERQYAAAFALELLSVAVPAQYHVMVAALSAARDVPGAPRGEPGLTLDAPLPVPGVASPPPHPRATTPEPLAGTTCACGAPSRLQNGACLDCAQRALGGP